MNRSSSTMILIAMGVIAASAAVVLYFQLGLSAGSALMIGIGLMLTMVTVQQPMERRRERAWIESRLAEIAAVAGDGEAEIEKIAARLNRLEQALPGRVREQTGELAAEVEVVGELLRQVTETLAELESTVDGRLDGVNARFGALERHMRQAEEPAGRRPRRGRPDDYSDEGRGGRPDDGRHDVSASMRNALFVPDADPALEREVERLIRDEQIELHLQPVVTLPQRLVRFYEVLTRLKGASGLVPAAEFIPVAEQGRLIAKLDTYQVIRSFQILKRLTQRNGDVGLYINLSAESLASSAFFREFQGFLSQNRAMADLVQFEFRQEALMEMGPLEIESLRAVADLGFHFSIDNVTDLRVDFRRWSDLGFRSIKVSADRLLGRAPLVTGDIHVEDMAGHLQRQGLTLIVDRVEQEAQVIDLLDYGLAFGQGNLFSSPRQVRPEVLGAAQAAAGAPTRPAPAGNERAGAARR
ncbi:putative EAL domain-containing protein [uncultured Pleomorphomonas sp.]|uniref:Putative EAL domain-containing protein n=1 Tax=uncultured Pleomorphomonas sp. TaxID=442121 RepID=A0A212LGU6_9HYPH|nr:EAL domain-containing protein [uncultured Pleomorphomonas sp.]SCM76687.1 putative EAL domain-containing protein [uncultured Pleomorphomonas sp.]